MKQGHLFVISAPSGAGKTTLVNRIQKRFPMLEYSISYTTRAPRGDEKDGREYHFISTDEFQKKINRGDWAEWANVCGNYYGTDKKMLRSWIESGKQVLMDIDVQGALQLKEVFPEAILIFIVPPSLEVLRQRLINRNTDSPEAIEKRLKIAKEEMAQKDHYSYQVINDNLDVATDELTRIFAKYLGTSVA